MAEAAAAVAEALAAAEVAAAAVHSMQTQP